MRSDHAAVSVLGLTTADEAVASIMGAICQHVGLMVEAGTVAPTGDGGPREAAEAILAGVEAEFGRLYRVAFAAALMARNWESVTGGYGPGGITPRALYVAVSTWRESFDA